MDCTPLEATIPTLQSAVKRIISDLPVPKIANLQEDQKNCHICMEPLLLLLLLLFPFLSLHQGTLTKGASITPMRSRLWEERHIDVAHISWEKSLQGAVPCVGPSSCIRYHCLQWNPRRGIVPYIYRSEYVNYAFDGSDKRKGLIIIEHRSLGLGRASAVALFSTLGMYRRRDTYL